MKKNVLFILIWVPGADKSTWVNTYCDQNPNTVVVSSDAIREELFGSEEDQQNPQQVFSLAHERVKYALSTGKDCIFDATNVVDKYRKAFIQDAKDCNALCEAVLFATDPDIAKQQNAARSRVVPEDVIDGMLKRFIWPRRSEGFDSISIVRSGRNNKSLEDYLLLNDIPHDCPQYHGSGVMEHMIAVQELDKDRWFADVLRYHDIGKYICKNFMYRGKPSNIANYFGHAEVGAYLAACAGMDYIKCVLIATHMDQFMRDWSPAKIPVEISEDEDFLEAFYRIHELDELESRMSVEMT